MWSSAGEREAASDGTGGLTRVADRARIPGLARWRRKLKRWLIGLTTAIVVVVALVLLALANLDVRPMKGWVRGAGSSRGVALDFDVGGVTIGGLRFAGIRIASPPGDAAIAPDLISDLGPEPLLNK